jgi:hypothetical protein
VVLAVEEHEVSELAENLDGFIEGDGRVQGAYVSRAYDTREDALDLRTWLGEDDEEAMRCIHEGVFANEPGTGLMRDAVWCMHCQQYIRVEEL